MDAWELTDLVRDRERGDRPYLEFLRVPSLSVGVYQLPVGGIDPQQPHTEDEVYYVAGGRGAIRVDAEDRAVQTGSVIFVAAGVDVVPGDLLEPELPTRLPDLMARCQAVIHAATAIPPDPAAPGAWDATTRLRTEGTRRLLDAALAAGAGRYLQQSIVMAYPDGGDRWLDEGTPLDDSPARAAVCAPVAAMEGMVRATDPERLGWCILRGGIFVGPGTGQDDLIARVRAGRVVVPGD